MRERRLILHDWEARSWERIGLILRPVKHARVCNHVVVGSPRVEGDIPDAPFQLGDRLWGAEAWRPVGLSIFYRAEGVVSGPWRPATNMHRDFSRLFATCVSCSSIQPSKLTREQYLTCGATSRKYDKYGWASEGWNCDWSRVGQLSHWTWGGKPRKPAPLTESDIALGTPWAAVGNQWEKDNPNYEFETSWAWAIEVKHDQA